MVKQIDQVNSIKTTISNLERVDAELIELFGEKSEDCGLFANRSVILQQYTILANTYHQLNTINFLENSKPASVFENEIRIVKDRVIYTKDTAFKIINEKIKFLMDQVTKIQDNENLIMQIISLFRKDLSSENDDFVLPLHLHNNPKLKQSIIFTLEEIRSKILIPARNILDSENSAVHKIIDSIELSSKSILNTHMNDEEIARMCELLSWGLEELNEDWEKIREVRIEISNSLRQELSNLRGLIFK